MALGPIWRRLGVFGKLVSLTVASALPFFVIAGTLFVGTVNRERAEAEHEPLALAREVAGHVDDYFRSLELTLITLAATVSPSAADLHHNDTLLETVRAQSTTRGIAFLNVWSLTGDNIGHSTGREERGNNSDRRYFQEARGGRLSVGDPVRSRVDGNWTLAFGAPVRDAEGRVAAVASISIRLQEVAPLLLEGVINDASAATIVSTNGIIIAGRDGSADAIGREAASVPGLSTSLNSPGVPTRFADAAGAVQLAGAVNVDSVNWKVVVATPEATALGPVRVLQTRVLALTSLAVAFAFLLVWGTSRQLRSQLRRLSSDVAAFSQGDLAHRASPQLQGEFSDVGQAFNRMAETLEARNAALTSSQAFAHHLLESNLIGVAIVSSAGTIAEANSAWLRLLRYAPDDLAGGGLSLVGLTHPPSRHLAIEALSQIERTQATLPWEQECVAKDGTIVPVLIAARALPSSTSQSVAFFIDLTSLRQAQADASSRAAELTALTEAMSEAILVLDANGCIEKVIPNAAAAVWGAPEALVGQTLEQVFSAPAADELRADVAAAVTFKQAQESDHAIKVDGQVRWYHSSVAPLGAASAVCVLRDVTERQRMAEQLLQSQKVETVGRLAGGIAHDFNNLLTVIMARTALAKGGANADAQANLQLVEQACHRASVMVRQLLTFARKQLVALRTVDVNAVVRDMTTLLEPLIGERIKLHINLATDTHFVQADPNQLSQVIMNLVVNARDAMPAGGEITIRTSDVVVSQRDSLRWPEVTPGQYVVLTVSDTGQGIPEESLSKIFEPFFTTKSGNRGTGLGLATCLAIVRQHGGNIAVESQLAHGTSFRVFLPITDAQLHREAERETDVDRRGSETVVVVEDDLLVREVSVLALRTAGYEVIEASSGEEALQTLTRHRPVTLVLTDVVLPGMSGTDLAAELRRRSPATKVLFTSGYTDDPIVNEEVEHARAAFIAKPFALKDLVAMVRRVIDG